MRKKQIKGFPNYYITDTGLVFNKKGVELKGWFWRHRDCLRKRVTLSFRNNEGRQRKVKSVARLVAIHFIPNPENKPEVNHKDGDTKNDHYENLEWVTKKENVNHAHTLGLYKGHRPVKIIGKYNQDIKTFRSIRACADFLGLKRTCNIYKAINEPKYSVKGYYIKEI